MADKRTRIIAGCMTGTSLDGLDVALVKIIGEGLSMKAELLGHHSLPIPDALRSMLMSLASGDPVQPIVTMRAARALGELHADGLEQLLAGELASPLDAPIDYITAHGQTIWHAPRDGKEELGGGPKSWQLFDPWPIVRRLKVPVCYDLRQADLIAGGEGAPLTPISDWVMYRGRADMVANLGGVFNASVWRNDESKTNRPVLEGNPALEGSDVCHCNLLLDGLAQWKLGEPFDRDGGVAAKGSYIEELGLAVAMYYRESTFHEHSLGRENVHLDAIKGLIESRGGLSTPDVLCTAAHYVAESVATWLDAMGCDNLVLAGGGVKNATLVKLIREWVAKQSDGAAAIILSGDLGIPCEAREAMAFAVLGALSQDGVPISLPQVTGATDPGVAGVWAGV